MTGNTLSAEALVRAAKKSKKSGNIKGCIEQMTRAIGLYCKLQKEKIDFVSLHLCEAYCLRALSLQETEPKSMTIFEDLKAALNLWQEIYEVDSIVEEAIELKTRTIILILDVIDLSQLKGYIEILEAAYRVILNIFKLKKVEVKEWLPSLWMSRRFNDALCNSVVNDVFFRVKGLAKLNAWEDALKENSFALQGFLQNLYFACTGSHNDEVNSKARSTFKKVQELAKQLEIGIDPLKKLTTKDIHYLYVAGYMHIDTSRRLVAHGELNEALFHAAKAYELFERVFKENFQSVPNSLHGQIQVKTEVGDTDFFSKSKSVDFLHLYLSPWKVMQSFLEGMLQLGTVRELLGNGHGAGKLFILGQHVSDSCNLPMFATTFSLLLGKVFIKESISAEKIKLKELHSKANSVLMYVEKVLSEGKTFCCLKCRGMCEATLDEYFGDLIKMRISAYDEKNVKEAHERYDHALELLNGTMWKNGLTCPEDITAKQICASSMCATACSLPMRRCWHCLPTEAMKSGWMKVLMDVKWEVVRRKLLLELHSSLVNCYENTNEEHKFLLGGISILVARNSFSNSFRCIPKDCINILVAVEIQEDIFAIERAKLILDICLYSLRHYGSELTSDIFKNPSSVKFDDIASWLTVAFVLSRQSPSIFKKVSRLLSVMFSGSSSREEVSLSHSKRNLSENMWAAYYHEASTKGHAANTFHDKCNDGSFSKIEDSLNSLGNVPKATKDLERHVTEFLKGHKSATIINISIIRPEYVTFLQQLMLDTASKKDQVNSTAKAWMLVSRICFGVEPFVLLLPLNCILRDDTDVTEYNKLEEAQWICPWNGITVIDDIVPPFREFVKAKSIGYLRNREDLQERFIKLLRSLEDSWLGPWIFVLIGEVLKWEQFDAVLERVVGFVKSDCKLNINKELLRIFLSASEYYCGEENSIDSKLCSEKPCYIAGVGYVDKAMCGILPISNGSSNMSAYEDAFKRLKKEFKEYAKMSRGMERKPIIFVLDCEVAMIPWESFPILKSQEIYRMPSVNSIFANIEKRNFSVIDPSDAYYLVGEGITSFWNKTREYFKSCNLEGIRGAMSNPNKLSSAMQKNNLFLYFDHNCGSKHIPRSAVAQLEKCPAAILMGCQSGACRMQGDYVPQCTPNAYLVAGSPFVISNLWNITVRWGHVFIKQLYKAMLEAKSSTCQVCETYGLCEHRPTIGSLMPLARENVPFMYEAGVICYGLPTIISGKHGMESFHESNKRRRLKD